MGRKKIAIKRIEGDSQRKATFEKRRVGLLKKAMELSILCDCELSVTIKPRASAMLRNSYYIYSSDPYNKVIKNFQDYKGEYTLLTNEHINDVHPGKVSSRDVGHTIIKTKDDDYLSSKKHYQERKPTPFVSIPMMVHAQNLRYLPAINMNLPPQIRQVDTLYGNAFQQLCQGLNLPPQIKQQQEKEQVMEPPKKKIKIEDGNKIHIEKMRKTEF